MSERAVGRVHNIGYLKGLMLRLERAHKPSESYYPDIDKGLQIPSFRHYDQYLTSGPLSRSIGDTWLGRRITPAGRHLAKAEQYADEFAYLNHGDVKKSVGNLKANLSLARLAIICGLVWGAYELVNSAVNQKPPEPEPRVAQAPVTTEPDLKTSGFNPFLWFGSDELTPTPTPRPDQLPREQAPARSQRAPIERVPRLCKEDVDKNGQEVMRALFHDGQQVVVQHGTYIYPAKVTIKDGELVFKINDSTQVRLDGITNCIFQATATPTSTPEAPMPALTPEPPVQYLVDGIGICAPVNTSALVDGQTAVIVLRRDGEMYQTTVQISDGNVVFVRGNGESFSIGDIDKCLQSEDMSDKEDVEPTSLDTSGLNIPGATARRNKGFGPGPAMPDTNRARYSYSTKGPLT